MNTIQQIVAKNIKELRAKRGIRTQDDLAEASGLAKTSIAQIETCAFWPSPKTLKQIADALDVPVNALFQDEAFEIKASPKEALKIIQQELDKSEKHAKSSDKTLHFLNKEIEKLALRLAAIDNPKTASYISQLVNGALNHLGSDSVAAGGQVKKNSS